MKSPTSVQPQADIADWPSAYIVSLHRSVISQAENFFNLESSPLPNIDQKKVWDRETLDVSPEAGS